MAKDKNIRWRNIGPYSPSNSAKAGLLEETRLFFATYARSGDLLAARQVLLDGALPQRSRATRISIIENIYRRLLSWNPPAWVIDDLVSFAIDIDRPAFSSSLLLHTVRQDTLLTDLLQRVILPKWHSGERELIRGDIQKFLDNSETEHPEISRWSRQTREKLASNTLTLLRDYGLLRGLRHSRAGREIIEPVVSDVVADHLAKLLLAEGFNRDAAASHSDWSIWLWDAKRAEAAVERIFPKEDPL